jgi:hypothetical protein
MSVGREHCDQQGSQRDARWPHQARHQKPGNEVKNGADAELKTYAKNSIAAGNEHLKEARELLAKLKK